MPRSSARRLFAASALLCLLVPASSADRVDEVVRAEMARRHIPGASVSVVRDGKVVLARGYGLANVELGVKASRDTVFEIGSMTKQFTATGVMMLAGEGKLRLDDKVSQHLPGMPDAWSGVSLRHLLTHTSGIKSYTDVDDFVKLARNVHTHDEIVKMVADLPPSFAPGAKWAYCNTGYYLLGMVIEKVSGKSYDDFMAERIFRPLGMSQTRSGDPSVVIPRRASGYQPGAPWRNAPWLQPTAAFGAGELVSTIGDLAKWDAALYTDRVLPKSALEQMWTRAQLNDGKTADYGFGWAIGEVAGHRHVNHGGGTAGFSTAISRYPDDRLTVIVLTNLGSPYAGALARQVAGTYVPALAPPVEKPIKDKDAATTARLKAVLAAAAEGKMDPAWFAPQTRARLFAGPDKEAQQMLRKLGPMRSFDLMEFREADGRRMLRYRAAYATESLTVTFALMPDGLISGLGVGPG